LPLLESFWYDNEGHTLPKYKYNQVAFMEGEKKFILRAGDWMYAPVTADGKEGNFEYVQKNFNPLEELQLQESRKKYLQDAVSSFSVFSEKIMNKGR